MVVSYVCRVPEQRFTVLDKYAVIIQDFKNFSYSFDCFCQHIEGNSLVLPTFPVYVHASILAFLALQLQSLFTDEHFSEHRDYTYDSHGIQCFRLLSQDGDIELNPGPHGNVDFVQGRHPSVNERTPELANHCSKNVYSSVTPILLRRPPMFTTVFYSYWPADLKSFLGLRTTLPHQVLLNVQRLNIADRLI